MNGRKQALDRPQVKLLRQPSRHFVKVDELYFFSRIGIENRGVKRRKTETGQNRVRRERMGLLSLEIDRDC